MHEQLYISYTIRRWWRELCFLASPPATPLGEVGYSTAIPVRPVIQHPPSRKSELHKHGQLWAKRELPSPLLIAGGRSPFHRNNPTIARRGQLFRRLGKRDRHRARRKNTSSTRDASGHGDALGPKQSLTAGVSAHPSNLLHVKN